MDGRNLEDLPVELPEPISPAEPPTVAVTLGRVRSVETRLQKGQDHDNA